MFVKFQKNMPPEEVASVIRTQLICKTVSGSIGTLAVAGVIFSFTLLGIVHYADKWRKEKKTYYPTPGRVSYSNRFTEE